MDFKLEGRTADWFDLALERQLPNSIPPHDVGHEFREVAKEDKPAAILKGLEARGLIEVIHPQLAKRHPDYEMLTRILRARDELLAAGLQAKLVAPVTYAALGRLKPREREEALERLGYRAAEIEGVSQLEEEAQSTAKVLTGRKTAAPADAFAYLEKIPGHVLVFIMAESSDAKVASRIRNYLHKWRPLRQALAGAELELESIGLARGPKFDKVIQDLFNMQLLGRARTPEDRIKVLRKLSGIKEAPKKPEEKKKQDEKLKKKLMGKKGTPADAPAPAAPAAKSTKQHESQPKHQAQPPARRTSQGSGGSSQRNKAPARAKK